MAILFNLQYRWWINAEIRLREKVSFTTTVVVNLISGRGISLFDRSFTSDNRLAMFLLPEYVDLVQSTRNLIQKTRPSTEQLSVLDIGANVGQFAATCVRFMNTRVVSYEPNPICWPHLENNSSDLPSWIFYKKAVSEEHTKMSLHFVLGKSAQGSFSRFNATENMISAKNERCVEVLSGPVTVSELESRGASISKFDLVKIDVEGFELEALRGLKEISFDFLLIEIAEHRDHGFTCDDVRSVAKDSLGVQLQEIYSDRPKDGRSTRNVLFEKIES